VAGHSDKIIIEQAIGYDSYLAYLVISDHKTEHKPSRSLSERERERMFYLHDSNKSLSSGNKA